MSLEHDINEIMKKFEAHLIEKKCPKCNTPRMEADSDDGTPTFKCPGCGHEEAISGEGMESKVIEADDIFKPASKKEVDRRQKDTSNYAECQVCKTRMSPNNKGCFSHMIDKSGKWEERIPYGGRGEDTSMPCGDCGVREGAHHHDGCDSEDCPRCHDQMLGCECWTHIGNKGRTTEGVETETEPITKPTTTPADPTPRPRKPSTPIRQKPGVTPKPKAENPDIELFLQQRGLKEAKINEQDPLKGVHPEKKEFIQTGDEKLNKLLPELSPAEQRYLVTIASDTYQETIRRIQEYTGIEVVPRNYPALVGLMFRSIEQAKTIESSHKRQLEEMALDLVFSVPEFKIVEEAYLNDELGFDIKLDKAELKRLTGQDEEDGLSAEEELNLDLADTFKGMSDEELRRKFSNLMITGGSYNKLFLYNMAAERLARIDANLLAYYGILASMAQLGYWVTPFGIEQAAAGNDVTSAGSEELISQDDKHIIKVRGTTFPYMVYELVKGIYEYLALDPSQQGAWEKDTIEDETKDMIAGPGVYKAVASYVPADRQELLPIVQKKLTALDADEIRDVIANNPNGRKIMGQLISQAENEMATYRKEKEEYNQ